MQKITALEDRIGKINIEDRKQSTKPATYFKKVNYSSGINKVSGETEEQQQLTQKLQVSVDVKMNQWVELYNDGLAGFEQEVENVKSRPLGV